MTANSTTWTALLGVVPLMWTDHLLCGDRLTEKRTLHEQSCRYQGSRLVRRRLGFSDRSRARLRISERVGQGHDAVEIALAKYKADLTLAPEEEELALLFPVEFNKVEELAKGLESSDEPVERRARFWLLVTLAWLLDHRSEYDDPYGLIDLLYADFEYPAEVAPLSGITSLEERDAPGLDGILQRWRDSVERWRAEYRARPAQSSPW